MKALGVIAGMTMATLLAFPPTVHAGGLGREIGEAAMRKILKQDLARDAATAAKRLLKGREVWRYTGRKQAESEMKKGLAPGSHMTSAKSGKSPLDAGAAQRRYGLPERPEVRETIRLDSGLSVRTNKALHGQPGVGELTSPGRIPPDAIRKVEPLK